MGLGHGAAQAEAQFAADMGIHSWVGGIRRIWREGRWAQTQTLEKQTKEDNYDW